VVESLFNRWSIIGVYFPSFFVVLDFQIIFGRIYFECTVPGIQSFTYIFILYSYGSLPFLHFISIMTDVTGSIGFFATYFFVRKIYGSIKVD